MQNGVVTTQGVEAMAAVVEGYHFVATGGKYCAENAGGVTPTGGKASSVTSWRGDCSGHGSHGIAEGGGGGAGPAVANRGTHPWILSAPAVSPHLDYDDELYFEDKTVSGVKSRLFPTAP